MSDLRYDLKNIVEHYFEDDLTTRTKIQRLVENYPLEAIVKALKARTKMGSHAENLREDEDVEVMREFIDQGIPEKVFGVKRMDLDGKVNVYGLSEEFRRRIITYLEYYDIDDNKVRANVDLWQQYSKKIDDSNIGAAFTLMMNA